VTAREQAGIFVVKADEDIHVLKTLLQDPQTSDAIWGFHAQQAVEKLLKALLSYKSIRFPFTHRLLQLADLLEDARNPVPDYAEPLLDLTPYAVEFRYSTLGSPNEPPLDRTAILGLITRLRDHVGNTVGMQSC
jgi:HEPN domain-containing protein